MVGEGRSGEWKLLKESEKGGAAHSRFLFPRFVGSRGSHVASLTTHNSALFVTRCLQKSAVRIIGCYVYTKFVSGHFSCCVRKLVIAHTFLVEFCIFLHLSYVLQNSEKIIAEFCMRKLTVVQ